MSDTMITVLMLSFSGSILALLLFILKPLLKNRVSKAFSYYVWILVLIRLVFPFGYVVNVSDFVPWGSREIGEVTSGTNNESFQSSNTKPTELEDAFVSVNNPSEIGKDCMNIIGPDNSGLNNNDLNNIGLGNGVLDNNILDNSALKNKIPVDKANSFPIIGVLIEYGVLIWLAGVLLSVLWYFLVYAIFSHRIYKFATVPHEKDMVIFEEMRGGNKKVRLICSSYIVSPMLMGIFKPIVVLPQFAYVANGMEIEYRNILRHELTHHRRHDTVYKWFAILVNSLHWFNPIIYLVTREIGRAGELSCDESVIHDMTATQRQSYGNTLLALAAPKRLPKGVTGTTMCEEKQQLKGRLINIKKYKKKSKWAIALMMVVALLLTGCASIFGSIERDKSENSTENENINTSEPAHQETGSSEPTTESPKEDTIENTSLDMELFETIFLPLARGEMTNNWDEFQLILSKAGYTYVEDEGTYSVMDNQYPDSYMGGDLTTRNAYAEVYSLTYNFIYDGVRRSVMVELREDTTKYYIDVTFSGYGTEVQTIEELIDFIENGLGDRKSTLKVLNTAMDKYKGILQGNTEFYSTDAKAYLNINQLDQAFGIDSSNNVKVSKFTDIDFGNDGTLEMIFWLTVNDDDYGVLILRYQDDVVYGYTLVYRSFMDLKSHGTFSFSGGVADYGYGTIEFTEKGYSIKKITYCESSYDSNNNISVSYFVDNEPSKEEEFLASINRHDLYGNHYWRDYTEENVNDFFTRITFE